MFTRKFLYIHKSIPITVYIQINGARSSERSSKMKKYFSRTALEFSAEYERCLKRQEISHCKSITIASLKISNPDSFRVMYFYDFIFPILIKYISGNAESND